MSKEAMAQEDAGARDWKDVTPAEREELLRSGWMYHDYQWFKYVGGQFDAATANAINQEILGRMAKAEMQRLMRVMKIRKVCDMPTLLRLMDAAGAVYVGSLCPMTLEHGADWIRLATERCFAHVGSVRDGLANSYRCGPMKRVWGWLSAMDIHFAIEPALDLCLLSQGRRCSYQIAIRFA
jgi:hypothetical protein